MCEVEEERRKDREALEFKGCVWGLVARSNQVTCFRPTKFDQLPTTDHGMTSFEVETGLKNLLLLSGIEVSIDFRVLLLSLIRSIFAI